MKTCSKCGVTKDVAEFGVHTRQKDGLQRNCKQCQREYFKSYRDENKDSIRRNYAKWTAANPGVAADRAKQSRRDDPERHAQYSRDYRARNPEKRRETCARYRRDNVARERLYRRIYASKNKDRLAAKSSLRRAMKLMATPAWANLEKIQDLYSWAMRLSRDANAPYHVDHIVPLISDIVCGLHCEANLRVVTGHENQSKSNRWWPNMP